MKKDDFKKLQLVQLEILKFLDSICKENDIQYYLMFGSLIGAIRHKGAIPWDPDIDVALFRDDYEKLCDVLIKRKDDYDYIIDHYLTNKKHISPHAILRKKNTHIECNHLVNFIPPDMDGIYIDIFPIDYVSDNEKKQNKVIKQVHLLRRIIDFKVCILYEESSTFKKVLKVVLKNLFRVVSFETINRKIDAVLTKYNYTKDVNNKNVMTLTTVKTIYNADDFGKGRTTLFEDFEVSIPQNAEKILEMTYGDYMTLPPEEERWSFFESGIFKEIDYGE